MVQCDFCAKKGEWKNVLVDAIIKKRDGSDLIICDECLNHYANGDYDKIKLKKKTKNDKNSSKRK